MSLESVTSLVARIERGEPGAQETLWELVYEDIKQLASARLRKLAPGQTLQATALVNEVWVRLNGDGEVQWQGRAHFFRAAARSMRNILVDQARRKQRLRRNSGQRPVELSTEIGAEVGVDGADILALDEALSALAREYDRPSQVVMLRFFTGLNIDEIARLLAVTNRTVDRDLLFARTWLRRYLDRA